MKAAVVAVGTFPFCHFTSSALVSLWFVCRSTLFVSVNCHRSKWWAPDRLSNGLSHESKKLKIMEGEVRPLLLDPPCNPMFILPWDPLRAQKSGLLILFSVTLERLAYFAVVMNLFLFLNKGQPEVFRCTFKTKFILN